MLKRKTQITLKFPKRELLEIFFQKALAAQCALEIDTSACIVSYSQKQEALVKQILKEFKKEYLIKIEED